MPPTRADSSQREFRRPNCCARPDSEPIGLIRGGAGRDRSAGRGARTARAVQRERPHSRLSYIQGSRLHLSAERWPAPALLEVNAPVALLHLFLRRAVEQFLQRLL